MESSLEELQSFIDKVKVEFQQNHELSNETIKELKDATNKFLGQ